MDTYYIPQKGEADPEMILAALKETLNDNPRLAEMPERVAFC